MDEVISMIGQPDEYSEWENVIDNEELPAIIYITLMLVNMDMIIYQ